MKKPAPRILFVLCVAVIASVFAASCEDGDDPSTGSGQADDEAGGLSYPGDDIDDDTIHDDDTNVDDDTTDDDTDGDSRQVSR